MAAEFGKITTYDSSYQETNDTKDVHGVEILVGNITWVVWVRKNGLDVILQSSDHNKIAASFPAPNHVELKIID